MQNTQHMAEYFKDLHSPAALVDALEEWWSANQVLCFRNALTLLWFKFTFTVYIYIGNGKVPKILAVPIQIFIFYIYGNVDGDDDDADGNNDW